MKRLEELLAESEYIQISPKGSSMYPFLREGRDQVILKRLRPEDTLRRGDVVLYRRSDRTPVLHRISKVGKQEFRLRGDNQFEEEGHIRREQMLAKLVSVVRRGKTRSVNTLRYRCAVAAWNLLLPLRKGYRKWKSFRDGVRRKDAP